MACGCVYFDIDEPLPLKDGSRVPAGSLVVYGNLYYVELFIRQVHGDQAEIVIGNIIKL